MKMKKHGTMYRAGVLALALLLAVPAAAGCGTASAAQTTEGSEQPPEKPDGGEGDAPEQPGDAPEKPDGEGGMDAGGAASVSYTAVNTYTADATVTGETIASTGTDENAILVQDKATVSVSNSTISRTSADSTGGDNSSFYGVGAAILTTDGTTYVSGSKITTDANGGAGVFSYGDGVSYVTDTTVTTKKDTSGGLHVAGGGTLYAWDVTATTNGESSAALRSDRDGGTMVVDGGTYTSNGTGSPAIYSTADIAVNGATLAANNSEAICIEGRNSIRLFNCSLTGNMKDSSQNDCTWNVILYQSMSGDSEVGNSTFEMQGGSLTAGNGGMFYTTNTESTFILKDVDITYAADNDFFLKCTGNSNQRGWGSSGANGADCTFTAIAQEMKGDVLWDSISELDFYLTDGSKLTGAVLDDESNAGSGGDGCANLSISSDSTWVVTADSELTSLCNAGTIIDENGKTVTVKGTDGTVYVQGSGSRTVTVEHYSTEAAAGATEPTEWSMYSVTKPAALATAAEKPSKVTLKTVKALGNQKIKVVWKKNSSADGYQIAYRVKGGAWKYTTVKSGSTLKKTLKSLKKGKTYQIKVRAYTVSNGKKVYGSFSSVKKVKCK